MHEHRSKIIIKDRHFRHQILLSQNESIGKKKKKKNVNYGFFVKLSCFQNKEFFYYLTETNCMIHDAKHQRMLCARKNLFALFRQLFLLL